MTEIIIYSSKPGMRPVSIECHCLGMYFDAYPTIYINMDEVNRELCDTPSFSFRWQDKLDEIIDQQLRCQLPASIVPALRWYDFVNTAIGGVHAYAHENNY